MGRIVRIMVLSWRVADAIPFNRLLEIERPTMMLLIRGTARTEDGKDFTLRARIPVVSGRILKDAWFMSDPVRRHLQRRLNLGREHGRLRLPNGLLLTWKLKPEWK